MDTAITAKHTENSCETGIKYDLPWGPSTGF